MTAAAGGGRGQRWTYRRLRLMLSRAYGVNSRGGPDTAAAAAALGVSPRTVQRWLRGKPRAFVALPDGRLEQIRRDIRPDGQSLTQEQLSAAYARNAIERIALPGGVGVLPAWKQRRWLEPHLVAVLELPAGGLRQVTVGRKSNRTLVELGKRGKVLSHTTVATRFHATALASAVLQQVDGWRVTAPAGLVKQGRTQTWVAAAPRVSLPELAVTQGLA